MNLRQLSWSLTTASTPMCSKSCIQHGKLLSAQEEKCLNVKKCYEMMNGDYEDVKTRFLTDARIRRFALLFLSDTSMEELRAAMVEKNCEKGFQAAHTLKGVCLNLGFTGLYVPVSRITEMLREGDFESAAAEMPGVETEYDSTVRGLHELEQL